MLKRLNIYFKEMYPILPRLGLGYLIAGEIYFIVLLNHGVTHFHLGIQELILGFTVFSFLCWLRIADDFKDYELDCRLFAHRPLPSGRVTKKDLKIFLCILIPVTLALNAIFMNNFLFCIILYTYGSLMAIWFFQKYKIQKSLPLALVTHNPVQFIMNIYIISFTVIKYDIKAVDLINVFASRSTSPRSTGRSRARSAPHRTRRSTSPIPSSSATRRRRTLPCSWCCSIS